MGLKDATGAAIDLAILAAVGGAVYVGYRVYRASPSLDQVASAVNPASPDNLIYKGTNSVLGEGVVGSAADYVFGGFDLLNPWAEPERKAYAKSVFGIGDL
jgi:hypothetical protein